METAEKLRASMDAAEDLQSVVTTMKGMAAVNIRQYERAVESLRDYWQSIERGFQVLLRREPGMLGWGDSMREGGAVFVVFGSDQGMCGRLNSEIAAIALDALQAESSGQRKLLVVGGRAAGELEAGGAPPDTVFHVPSSISELNERVQDVVLRVERWRAEAGMGRVRLFHNRPRGGASYEPATLSLLPLDLDWLRALAEKPWPTRCLPGFPVSGSTLFAALVREYLFAALYRAFAESLASENASRLAAMQSAEKNIDERIQGLRMRYHQRRQAAITEELLDVISGFETLAHGKKKHRNEAS